MTFYNEIDPFAAQFVMAHLEAGDASPAVNRLSGQG